MNKYIDCDAALEIIREKQKELCFPDLYGRSYARDKEAYDTWEEVLDSISAIPVSDVVPVQHGRWILNTDDFTPNMRCSVCAINFPVICGDHTKTELYNHCPNCGAKMDLEADNGE